MRDRLTSTAGTDDDRSMGCMGVNDMRRLDEKRFQNAYQSQCHTFRGLPPETTAHPEAPTTATVVEAPGGG